MLKKLKNNNSGFTIIETLIVLAIAGLIILIVLLAVPALQRTSRNTDIKNDAASIAGAINEYESNNGGTPPPMTAGAQTITGGSITVGTSGAASNAKVQGGDTIYVDAALAAPAVGTAVGDLNPGVIVIVPGMTCETPGTAVKSSYAVYYPIEVSGGTIATPGANDCSDS